jgi:hypothetical protein
MRSCRQRDVGVEGVDEVLRVSSTKDGKSGVPAPLLSVTAIQDVTRLTKTGVLSSTSARDWDRWPRRVGGFNEVVEADS